MLPRTNYIMTKEDLDKILDACKPTPCIMIGGYTGSSPQENANRAWAELGSRMGFDPMTVRPVEGQGSRCFSAVPCESEAQQKERKEREHRLAVETEIAVLEGEIEDRKARLNLLKGETV